MFLPFKKLKPYKNNAIAIITVAPILTSRDTFNSLFFNSRKYQKFNE
jgi:hypothetical protein